MKAKPKKNKITKFSQELASERGQRLLQCYLTKEMVEGQKTCPVGTLVWAKMTGSVYWPAIIADLEDKPADNTEVGQENGEDPVDPNSCAMVVFLEDKFRFYPVVWERVIPVLESELEEQKDLVIKRSIVESKKPNCCNSAGFKRALEYLKEFVHCEPENRYKTAQSKFFQVRQNKSERRSRTSNDSSLKSSKSKNGVVNGKVTLEWGTEVSKLADQFTDDCRETPSPSWFNGSLTSKRSSPNLGSESSKDSYRRKRGASLLPDLKKTEEPSRKHGRYSLRPPPVLQPLPQIVEPQPVIPVVTIPDGPQEDDEIKSKLRRPKGGKELREWAKDRFEELDKSFRLEPQNPLACASSKCGQPIQAREPATFCHDLPFHARCLIDVSEGDGIDNFKCRKCLEKRCALCDVADDSCVKCSKCDLRYHIHCLRPFPQAEIQSETGPITCPIHFCHTCIAEHQIMKKVRNYKAAKSSNTIRCIKCPTAYHRACVPASCLTSTMPLGLVVCPRHQNFPATKGKSRRLGCFMCNRRLNAKGKQTVVNCIKCPLAYHLDCVVDVSNFETQDALLEYMNAFECEACFWGLYPLPGQAVWCQQASFSFWPARILYPKELMVRSAMRSSPEEFSVVYFGGKPAYYDKACYTRVVPLNIGAYDVLKKIKMYTDDPKQMTAYEEGTYVMDLSDSHRTSILQPAEPVYKKIERNVYKTVKPRAIHKKTQHNDSCSCSEDKSLEKICEFGSGCINRDQAIECTDSTCGDLARCTNRMFSNFKLQPCYDNIEFFPTTRKGWGVRTNIPLKKGDFVIEYLGEVISKDLYQWRLQRKDGNDALYFLELDTNLYIDAEYMGNLSRLINHSCEPNCSTEKYISQGKQVVGIFANCDIQPGTELTFDYDYETSGKPFTCACGAIYCRGQINRTHIRNNQVGDSAMNSDESPSQGRLDEEWNEECEICGYAGSVLCCEAPNCRKAYHATCLGLNSVPSGTWICPQHDTDQGRKPKKKKKNSSNISSNSNNNGAKKLARLAAPKRNDKENVQSKGAKKVIRSKKESSSSKIGKEQGKHQQSRKKARKDANTNETDTSASTAIASSTAVEP